MIYVRSLLSTECQPAWSQIRRSLCASFAVSPPVRPVLIIWAAIAIYIGIRIQNCCMFFLAMTCSCIRLFLGFLQTWCCRPLLWFVVKPPALLETQEVYTVPWLRPSPQGLEYKALSRTIFHCHPCPALRIESAPIQVNQTEDGKMVMV